MTTNQRDPRHIAIIMDGNGRWAKARGRDRVFGHIKGTRVAKKVVEYCVEMNLQALTLYAFSEENWGRPAAEVNFLMRLLSRYITRERQNLIKNNIRFRCIGQLEKLPEAIRSEVAQTMQETNHCTGMVLTFALSYGGRQEITQAVRNLVELANQNKVNPSDISEDFIGQMLQTAPLEDPDLLIRTSGECRLSNFLPWQTVYSELYFTETLWPDFTKDDFFKAIESFRQRERRFGKVSVSQESEQQLTN